MPRDEARAALAARRELGPDFEDEVVEAFVEKVEKAVAKRGSHDLAAEEDRRGMSMVVAFVSLGTGIPITAIALANGGVPALVVAWIGIFLVNVVVARAR